MYTTLMILGRTQHRGYDLPSSSAGGLNGAESFSAIDGAASFSKTPNSRSTSIPGIEVPRSMVESSSVFRLRCRRKSQPNAPTYTKQKTVTPTAMPAIAPPERPFSEAWGVSVGAAVLGLGMVVGTPVKYESSLLS